MRSCSGSSSSCGRRRISGRWRSYRAWRLRAGRRADVAVVAGSGSENAPPDPALFGRCWLRWAIRRCSWASAAWLYGGVAASAIGLPRCCLVLSWGVFTATATVRARPSARPRGRCSGSRSSICSLLFSAVILAEQGLGLFRGGARVSLDMTAVNPLRRGSMTTGRSASASAGAPSPSRTVLFVARGHSSTSLTIVQARTADPQSPAVTASTGSFSEESRTVIMTEREKPAKPAIRNTSKASVTALACAGLVGHRHDRLGLSPRRRSIDMFCKATGFDGTPQVVEENSSSTQVATDDQHGRRISTPTRRVEGMPWRFKSAETPKIEVQPRRDERLWCSYRVKNTGTTPSHGRHLRPTTSTPLDCMGSYLREDPMLLLQRADAPARGDDGFPSECSTSILP